MLLKLGFISILSYSQSLIFMSEYNRKDHLHQKAKDDGYRSRAAYKLLEIQKSYKVFNKQQTVLDLGCWPGGWLQVASPLVSKVIGIDIASTESLPEKNITILTGDARENIEALKNHGPYQVVMSDMSPKLTGIRAQDEAGILDCAELTFDIALQLLSEKGAMICKLFPGNDVEAFIKKTLNQKFTKMYRTKLDSSRNSSNEFYIIGVGFKNT